MFLSIADQVIILLASVYGGLLLGLLFDLYRFVRGVLRFGKGITTIGDIIFWILGIVLILSVMYKSNSGLIRVYQLLGFVSGVALYFRFLSGIVGRMLHMLVYCVRGFVYAVLKISAGPVNMVLNILWRLHSGVKRKTINLSARLSAGLKAHFKNYMPSLKKRK